MLVTDIAYCMLCYLQRLLLLLLLYSADINEYNVLLLRYIHCKYVQHACSRMYCRCTVDIKGEILCLTFPKNQFQTFKRKGFEMVRKKPLFILQFCNMQSANMNKFNFRECLYYLTHKCISALQLIRDLVN
jgi:hypothetical protein